MLVDENAEISVAKSTIAEQNRSAANRPPKPSLSTAAAQAASSSAAATTSAATANSQSAASVSTGASATGGKFYKNIRQKRNAVIDLLSMSTSTAIKAIKPTPATLSMANSNDFSLHDTSSSISSTDDDGSTLPFDLFPVSTNPSIPSSSTLSSLSSMSFSVATTSTSSESNWNYAVTADDDDDNVGDNNGVVDGSVDDEFVTTKTFGNPLPSVNGVGLTDDSNAFDVTHASSSNNEQHLTDTNVKAVSEQLTNDAATHSDELIEDIGDDVNEASDTMSMQLQNDEPAVINFDEIEFISIDDEINETAEPPPLGVVEIHPLDGNGLAENNVPYIVEPHPPDQPYTYQMHDASFANNTINSSSNDQTQQQQFVHQPQRILVNVSIATDSGSGTRNHAVYMLHVSVPTEPNVDEPIITQVLGTNSDTINRTLAEEQNGHHTGDESMAACSPPEPPPLPSVCPCDCSAKITGDRNETEERDSWLTLENETEDFTDSNTTDDNFETTSSQSTTINSDSEQMACLNSQEIPTILILEGETSAKIIYHQRCKYQTLRQTAV